MWPASRSGQSKDRLVSHRRRQGRRPPRLSLPGDQFLEQRVLLSTSDPSSAFVSPHFTDLVQPPRATDQTVPLPTLPPASSSGTAALPANPAGTGAASSGEPLVSAGDPVIAPETSAGYNLGFIDTQVSYTGTLYATRQYLDYTFKTLANATTSDYVFLSFPYYPELELFLLDANGNELAAGTEVNGGLSLSLSGLSPNTYTVQVYGYDVPLAGVSYGLQINPPAFVPADAFGGQNDTWATAAPLGLLSNSVTVPNLTLDSTYITSGANDVGWYRFQTTGEGTSNDYVAVDFDPSQAPVFLALYDGYGDFLGVRDATGVDTNGFGLLGAPAQVYYIAAFTGPALGTNSDYSLNFVLPPPIPKDQYSSQPGGNATFATAADLITPNSSPKSDVQSGLQQYGTSSAPSPSPRLASANGSSSRSVPGRPPATSPGSTSMPWTGSSSWDSPTPVSRS